MSNFVNLLDIIYPVGSVYITFSDVSPANSVGGSWEKIDGKFLQSSSETDSLNSTGGFSGNIGFTFIYGSYYGAVVPTYNADVDDSLLNIGPSGNTVNYTPNIVKLSTKWSASEWNHRVNSSVTGSTHVVPNPRLYSKDIYWDSRPAYITCNMYKRTA